jgi:hypothetical protein
MLTRRDLIASGGVLTHFRPEEAAAAQQSDAAALQAVASAIRDLRQPPGGTQVAAVRDRQRNYLRQNQRYPEYIDVGMGAWERLLDWHIFMNQELKISRGPDGRYLMEFMITHLVLRPEIGDLEIGLAYDR